MEPNEPLVSAAYRELREETSADLCHLEQLHTFGDPGRDPRGWTISVAFLARLEEGEAEGLDLRAGSDAREVAWFYLDALPPLAFDHEKILNVAKASLAAPWSPT